MISSKESKLASLRLLFSTNFDDNDLLSILEEAQDDLDLAIARISEGQTEQWEMKSKKIPASRGRGRGGHSSRPPKSVSNTPQISLQNPQKGPAKIVQKKNRKVEIKHFNSKEADSKTSWAQLVKGAPEENENIPTENTVASKKNLESGSNRLQNKKSIAEKKSLVVTLSTKQGTQKESILTSTITTENSNLPPGLLSGSNSINVKKSAAKQKVAVVMPSNSQMSSMGVQFGSLKVNKDEESHEKVVKDTKRIHRGNNEANGSNKSKSSEKINVTGANVVQSYPSAAPTPYFQQIPGFGMVNTGNGDFQQVYGAENAHGYYANQYSKFSTGAQEVQTISTAATTQSLAISGQGSQQASVQSSGIPQQYAMPFGYYPYYMPGQFQNAPNAHQPYGAQFVNKNVYHYGPSGSGTPVVTSNAAVSSLPATNTQISSRNTSVPVTGAAYPFASMPPLYGNAYDESLSMYGNAAPNGNINFQTLNGGFGGASSSQAHTSSIRGTSAPTSGSNFSNQRPAHDKFSNNVTAPLNNATFYHPDQPSFGNQYQHQHQQYYIQHQQPQQVLYGNGAYGNGRNNQQQHQQYWTANQNNGQ